MADRVEWSNTYRAIITPTADDLETVFGKTPLDRIVQSEEKMESYTFESGDKWYYAPAIVVTNLNNKLIAGSDDATDLVGASGDLSNPTEAAGGAAHFVGDTSGSIDADEDKIKWIYLKNNGYTDYSADTITDEHAHIVFNNGAASGSAYSPRLAPGQSMILQPRDTSGGTSASFVSAIAYGGTTNACTVKVLAIINDAA